MLLASFNALIKMILFSYLFNLTINIYMTVTVLFSERNNVPTNVLRKTLKGERNKINK